MKISLIEAWNEKIRPNSQYAVNFTLEDFLREQDTCIQAEHELEVAREVVKVLDEIKLWQSVQFTEDKEDISVHIDEIRARYSAKLEEKYPCERCGTLRTKADGGTTFTVCDECWDKEKP